MYYIIYLSGLCRRRRWGDPLYKCFAFGSGFVCTVSVNHREYQTETAHATEELAKEAAAMKAYLICRNLSLSEGQAAAAQFPAAVSVGSGSGGSWAGRGG